MREAIAYIPNLIDYLLSFTLVFSVLLLGTKRLHTKVSLFALQSLSLVLVLFFIGILHHSIQALFVAFLTLIGKFLIIPAIFLWVIKKVPIKKDNKTFFTLSTSMLIGGGLILIAHYQTSQLHFHGEQVINNILHVGISLVFIGLFLMTTRTRPFTQILGLYVLDNGIYCLALATVFEMPLIIEIGILFELLLSVLVLGMLIYRIHKHYNIVNINELKGLKG